VLYDVAGTLNSALIIISLVGVWPRARKIWTCRGGGAPGERPTAILSLNQFTVSFLAYWSFFVCGHSIAPFHHYIVWPRLVATVTVLVILREIFLDRARARRQHHWRWLRCCWRRVTRTRSG